MDRLSLHLLQVTTYLLLCSIPFLDPSQSPSSVITSYDQSKILSLTLASLVVLAPIQPSKVLSPVWPLCLSFIALGVAFAITFLAMSYSRITLICIVASVACGLAVGLSVSPLVIAIWNVYGRPTRYYRKLIDDIDMVRKITQSSEKEEVLLKEDCKEMSKIQQTDETLGGTIGQTLSNTFAHL